MNFFLHYAPFWLRAWYPEYRWREETREKKIFLTFDDGPIPQVTEFVLATLAQYHAKATFFCIGDNVRKHPDIYAKVLEAGHSVGNHTYNHVNGWKTDPQSYLVNFEKCRQVLNVETKLFRPPYGRMKKRQSRLLPAESRIIMWDVLTGDFSADITPKVCLSKSIQYTREGSIVLFHDSLKAWRNMSFTLPAFLDHFTREGYTFEALSMR